MLPASLCRAVILCLALAACDSRLDKVDPILDLDRNDYRDLHRERAAALPPVPHLSMRAHDTSKSGPLSDKLVSISVNENIPLRDVLMELASKAGVNLELDPRISGGVIFTAKRQPFSRVLNRLCSLAGLRYEVEDEFLRIELDEPFIKTYDVDYLTLIRKSRGDIGIATNVFANIGGAGRGSNVGGTNSTDAASGNNSTTRVETSAVADFWTEVEGNVESILSNTKNAKILRAAGENVKTQMKEEGLSTGKPFTVNRQAGLITVFGTGRQHAAIEKYIARLKRNTNAQVLIEARIIEVNLSEGYESGINWRTLTDGLFDIATRFGPGAMAAPFVAATTATDGMVTLSLKDNDFAGILNFMRGFGTTRTLSSPRLTVLNNQPAVLKVARNEVYFTSNIETTPIVSGAGGSPVGVTRTITSTPNTVPVGFLMTVQPSINLDRNEVTLNMRPTVSFIVDRVEDPGVKITAADAQVPEVSSSIPVVAVREMDSVLTIPSGTVAVMGGLMQDGAGNIENGVPFVDEVPIVGNLAKARNSSAGLSELVILLRATISYKAPEPDEADAELYRKYSRDRRPLPMPRLRYEDLSE